MQIVAVRDRAAEAYMRPFFVGTANMAIRSFMDEVNREHAENQLFAHPDDFDLYELGVFDDNSGSITCHETPKLLMLGKQAKN